MSWPRSLRVVGAEQAGSLWLAEVAGLLHDRRDLRVGDEARPPLLVPVEERPHPVLLAGVAEDRRALAAVVGALLRALGAEDLEEVVDVLDGRGCQDHRDPPRSGGFSPRPRPPDSTDVAQIL